MKHPDVKKKKEKVKDKTAENEQSSEEENIKRRKEYTVIINNFLHSSRQTHEFPSTLNSYERRLVHEICDEVGLQHESQGEGKERHIVLQKKSGVPADGREKNIPQEKKDEDGDEKKKAYEDIIEAFMKSVSETYEFPPDLNVFERSLVHDVCEKLGLIHKSEGDGKKRCIIVRKPTTGSQNTNKSKTKLLSGVHKDKDAPDVSEQSGETKRIGDVEDGVTPGYKSLINCETIQSGALPKSKILTNSDGNQTGAVPKSALNNSGKKIRTRFVGGRYEEVVLAPCENSGRENSLRNAMKHCCNCGKDIPEQNYSIHSAQCERKMNAAADDRSSTVGLPRLSFLTLLFCYLT